MKKLGPMLIIFLSILVVITINPANANYNIYKYKTNSYNFAVTVDGSDLQNIKSSKIIAWSYASSSAKWFMDNYLSGFRTAKEYQDVLALIDINIPITIAATSKGVQYYIALRLWYNFVQHAPEHPTQLVIYTVCPPYPSKWYANGY